MRVGEYRKLKVWLELEGGVLYTMFPINGRIALNKYGGSGRVEQTYLLDLNDWSCNCPDFLVRRAHLDQSDPERLCKHLRAVRGVGTILAEAVRSGGEVEV